MATLDIQWNLALRDATITDLANALLDVLRGVAPATLSVDNREDFEDCQGMTKQVVNGVEIVAHALPEDRSLRH